MIYHVLPGDAQVEEFRKARIEGELIVFREALITGPVDAVDPYKFWDERAQYILTEYGEDVIDYQEKVADEIERVTEAGEGDEVNLWFEYELFCGVNMWFCLDRLKDSGAEIYRIAPINVSPDDVWDGFGEHKAEELVACYESRTKFSEQDIEAGSKLWNAFASRNAAKLLALGEYRSPCFPFLKEVCEAAAEIESRPVRLISELRAAGLQRLEDVFPEFKKREGVYGFGDLQIERLLESA